MRTDSMLSVVESRLARSWQQVVPPYRINASTARWLEAIVFAYAIAQLIFVGFLFLNHWHFPLFLEVMEGTVFQHFQRAVALQPVYPIPGPELVPLAYNPFYYYFSAPFAWIFGVQLPTLRLTAFIGMAMSALLIYLIVRRRTGSAWWGIIAAGLFAAAYRVMDSYLDTAHSDSWLIASVLLGAYLIDRSRSRLTSLVGVIALVAAFWFKQHGAIFAIFGVLYLTWRDGPIGSILYWGTAITLGPIVYIFAGPWLFGSAFHYFTWEVPRGWSEVGVRTTVLRYGYHLVAKYGALFFAAVIYWVMTVRNRESLTVWHFMLPAAVLSGLMGSLDAGSANNVYIPVGTILIVTGVIAFADFARRAEQLRRPALHVALLVISFALLVYNPRSVISSSGADAAYADLIATLKKLDGPVYSPSLGQLPAGYTLYPTALWVALDDMTRGAHAGEKSMQKARALVAPAIPKSGDAYVLMNMPLKPGGLFGDLYDQCPLQQDLGSRFAALAGTPGRFGNREVYPRYLYACKAAELLSPSKAAAR